jgi:hypothetical protein
VFFTHDLGLYSSKAHTHYSTDHPWGPDPSSNGGRVKFWVGSVDFSSNVGIRTPKERPENPAALP